MASFHRRFKDRSLSRPSIFFVFSLFCSFIGLAGSFLSQAYAESYNVFGVPFHLEALKSVDSNNVEVTLFGETRILSKSDLEATIVAAYFKNTKHRFSLAPGSVQSLITEALKANKPQIAAHALLAVFTIPREKEVKAESVKTLKMFLEGLGPFETKLSAFEQSLELLDDDLRPENPTKVIPALVAVPLLEVGLNDLAWLRAHAVRLVFHDEAAFKEYAIDKTARLDSADKGTKEKIVALLLELFGQGDPLVISFKRITLQLKELENARLTNQLEGIYPLAATCEYEPLSEKLVCPVVSRVLEEGAERLLHEGTTVRAITVLARADFHRRTPKTHEIMQKMLEALDGSEISLLHSAENAKMLRSYSAVDSNIREAFGEYLERQIDFLARSDQVEAIETVLSNMIAIRPDPDPENDKLRVDQALRFVKAGMRNRAINELESIRTGIGIFQRLRLGLSGLYINQMLAFVLLIAVLAAALWYARFEMRRMQAARKEREQDELDRARLAGSGFHAMRPPGSEPIINHELREYEALLMSMGLDFDTSLKGIKSAYRQSVKQFHPDAQQSEGVGQASQQFIELTNAYDRILELRKALGLPDDE